MPMNVLSKIITAEKLAARLVEARKSGKEVVFTNGCFDILHAGHVRYLAAAGAEGDLLVVGMNSDASVRLIKGGRRPVVHQDHRAEVLASLGCVDYVVLYDAAQPFELIQALKPDVLVKGADWTPETIVGSDFVKSNGGSVVRISLVPEISTSRIIEKILELHRQD
jgi:D-beta-D-heptose 7-phosphate kinase/D-beta-D-heptose 1-phosphate adenosyltransferase